MSIKTYRKANYSIFLLSFILLCTLPMTFKSILWLLMLLLLIQGIKIFLLSFHFYFHKENNFFLSFWILLNIKSILTNKILISANRYLLRAAPYTSMDQKFEVHQMHQWLSNTEPTLVWHALPFGCLNTLLRSTLTTTDCPRLKVTSLVLRILHPIDSLVKLETSIQTLNSYL